MEHGKVKRRRWPWVLAAVLLALAVLFAATRYTEHTTFIPFSGRVFQLSPQYVSSVCVQSGSSGELIELRPDGAFTPAPNTGTPEPAELPDGSPNYDEALELLNGFRYRLWMPDLTSILGGSSGWSYRIILNFADGSSASYRFGSDWISVRGFVFRSGPGALYALTGLVSQ